MAGRIVNVRLDEERLRNVQQLRRAGVGLSDRVREGINRGHAQIEKPVRKVDVGTILENLDRQFPLTEKDVPPRGVNVHDRRELAAYIRDQMRQRKRRI